MPISKYYFTILNNIPVFQYSFFPEKNLCPIILYLKTFLFHFHESIRIIYSFRMIRLSQLACHNFSHFHVNEKQGNNNCDES